jgi:hypothetical protein
MKHTALAEKNSNESDIWINVMKRKNSNPLFAICVNNSGYPASLELHKVYRVLPDENAEQDGDLRVIDESGEDYLYPSDYFMLVELPRDVQRALLQAS